MDQLRILALTKCNVSSVEFVHQCDLPNLG